MDPSQLGAGEPSRSEVPSRCARVQDAPWSRSLPARWQEQRSSQRARPLDGPASRPSCLLFGFRTTTTGTARLEGGEGAGLEGRGGAGTEGKRGTRGNVVLAGEDGEAISPLSPSK